MKEIVCPSCGKSRFVSDGRYYIVNKNGENGYCYSCGVLVAKYGIELATFVSQLEEQGCASLDDMERIIKMQGIYPYGKNERNNCYRLLRKRGIKFEYFSRSKKGRIRNIANNVNSKTKTTACSRCGSTENVELHHIWPLEYGGAPDGEVIQLCKKCHIREHKRLNSKISREYGSLLDFKNYIFSMHRNEISFLF